MVETAVTEVVVYSKPNCPQCTMTYRLMDSLGVPYRSVDVTQVPAALAYVTEELHYSSAPIVVVSDQHHWSGFQPDKIKMLAQ